MNSRSRQTLIYYFTSPRDSNSLMNTAYAIDTQNKTKYKHKQCNTVVEEWRYFGLVDRAYKMLRCKKMPLLTIPLQCTPAAAHLL